MFFSCPRGFCHWIKEHWLPFVIFLAFSAFLIGKALYLEGCFAFDQNDDHNHTFVNLFASREIMREGGNSANQFL